MPPFDRKSQTDTIHDLKVWRLVLIYTLISIGAFALAGASSREPFAVLDFLPWQSMGEAALAVTMVAFTFEWTVRRESERKIQELLDRSDNALVARLEVEVPKWMFTDPAVIKSVLSDDLAGRIIRSGLERNTGDPSLAAGLSEVMARHAGDYRETWAHYENKITVGMGKAKTQGVRVPKSGFYLVDYEIRYETTLKNSELIFAVVNTMEDFNRLLNDPRLTVRWLSFAPAAFPLPTVDVFDVVNASVAGLPLAIARVQREGRHEITATSADMSALIGKHVVVSYRYRAMVPKSAHVLFADIAIPTKDAKIEFDFRDTDMAYVNVHDFFVSNRPVDLQYFPNYAEASVITVRAQDWLFPKSGAVFTWALTSETRDGSAGRPGAGRLGRAVGSSPVS